MSLVFELACASLFRANEELTIGGLNAGALLIAQNAVNCDIVQLGVNNWGSSLRLTFDIFLQESNVDLTPTSK